MSNRIELDVLRDVTNRILDFIEHDLQMKSVELPHNFYWSIAGDDELYKMDDAPEELACGSLVDDYDFVSSAHKDRDQAIPLVLMHVAPLLRALATAVPNYKLPKK
jgi:hypothetical protein